MEAPVTNTDTAAPIDAKPSKPKAKPKVAKKAVKKPAPKKAAKPKRRKVENWKPKAKPKTAKKPKEKKAVKKTAKKKTRKTNGPARSERLDLRVTKAEKARIVAKSKAKKRTLTSLVMEAIDKIK